MSPQPGPFDTRTCAFGGCMQDAEPGRMWCGYHLKHAGPEPEPEPEAPRVVTDIPVITSRPSCKQAGCDQAVHYPASKGDVRSGLCKQHGDEKAVATAQKRLRTMNEKGKQALARAATHTPDPARKTPAPAPAAVELPATLVELAHDVQAALVRVAEARDQLEHARTRLRDHLDQIAA